LRQIRRHAGVEHTIPASRHDVDPAPCIAHSLLAVMRRPAYLGGRPALTLYRAVLIAVIRGLDPRIWMALSTGGLALLPEIYPVVKKNTN
jgi:hypothetical protein